MLPFRSVVFSLAALCSIAQAALYADSINYCSASQIILIDTFDIILYPSNDTVAFSIVAESVPNSVDASINIQLDAYGLSPINTTVDLCSVASGVLCPLPAYQFNGTATYFLSNSFLKDVPKIAYSIPNLEASVRVTLTDNASGQEASCLDISISNGLTTEHAYVSWAVGAVVILGFLVALIHPLIPIGETWLGWDYRLLGLVAWLQHIASSGMINVDYPELYTAFTRNFAWTFGLIYIEPLQQSLAKTAFTTGGTNYTQQNAIQIGNAAQTATANGRNLASASGALQLAAVTVDQSASSVGPISTYAERLAIQPATVFGESLVIFLILAAIMIGCVLLLVPLALALARHGHNGSHKSSGFAAVNNLAIGNAVRWLLVVSFPLATLAIYQFQLSSKTGWALILVTGIMFALLLIGLLLSAGWLARKVRRSDDGVDCLFENPQDRHRYGIFVGLFKRNRAWFGAFFFVAMVLRAVFLGALQSHGLVQIIALLAIEAAMLLLLIIFRPFEQKGNNVLEGFLTIARLVDTGLLITFLTSINANRIVATIIGLVLLVIQGVVALILIINLLVRLVIGLIWAIRHDRPSYHKTWKEQDMAERTVDNGPSHLVLQPANELYPGAYVPPPADVDDRHVAEDNYRDSYNSQATLVDQNAPEAAQKRSSLLGPQAFDPAAMRQSRIPPGSVDSVQNPPGQHTSTLPENDLRQFAPEGHTSFDSVQSREPNDIVNESPASMSTSPVTQPEQSQSRTGSNPLARSYPSPLRRSTAPRRMSSPLWPAEPNVPEEEEETAEEINFAGIGRSSPLHSPIRNEFMSSSIESGRRTSFRHSAYPIAQEQPESSLPLGSPQRPIR